MIPLLSIEQATKLAREIGVPDRFAPSGAFRGLLNNPTATVGFFTMFATLRDKGALDARTRELVILRTGWRTRSEYEFCTHVRAAAEEHRLSQEEILGVRNPDSCRAFSDTDRAVLKMADELHDQARVSSETWTRLEKAFSTEQLVELLLVSGFWRMIAGFLKTAQIPLDPNTPSWPEGRVPS